MFESVLNGTLDLEGMLICFISSIVLGIIIALIYINTSKHNKNFSITLTILPILVCVIIMLVNGNLGTSIAIVGAFSLVKFRSIPGNSKEIVMIFYAMTIGLILGTGYIFFAVITTIIIGLLIFILFKINFGDTNKSDRILKILIPEDLDYEDVFDDTLKKYTKSYTLEKIKTTNMGSLYELTYKVEVVNINEKEFIDELRIKNGNLKIMLSRDLENGEL